jgi:formamidopyrimidine-DNA glycosylase
MPELPEVEFARGCLEKWLGGQKLARVEADQTRILRGSSRKALESLAGHELREIDRKGKWLLWKFDGERALLDHLGMTGKFVLQPSAKTPVKFSRVRFFREDGHVVHYTDPRMFGCMRTGSVTEIRKDKSWSTLGPDAWNDAPTGESLFALLHGRKRAVKDLLMDQTLIAGVGNIYATEAFWFARVHPARRGTTLTLPECKLLARGLHKTLAFSIGLNKGDKITYVEEGPPEDNPFDVYGRTGEPCPRDGTTLKSLQIAGRTSVFCPTCQPLRPKHRTPPKRAR